MYKSVFFVKARIYYIVGTDDFINHAQKCLEVVVGEITLDGLPTFIGTGGAVTITMARLKLMSSEKCICFLPYNFAIT